MRVLLTNDDGWGSDGLEAMARALAGLRSRADEAVDLVIAAPREQKSAAGHAITLREPLGAEEVDHPVASRAFLVDGTPADCVKLAVTTLFSGEARGSRLALCVSGVNDGPNVGVNVFYSGTVGAALEAVVNGVPAVAVSKEFGEEISFDQAARLAAPIVEAALAHGLPAWHTLNVNVPNRPPAEIRGTRLTRHGVSGFEEWYTEAPRGPRSPRRLFTIEGDMRLRDTDGTTDAEALTEGYVSVTPLGLDLTARGFEPGAAGPGEWGWLAEVELGRG